MQITIISVNSIYNKKSTARIVQKTALEATYQTEYDKYNVILEQLVILMSTVIDKIQKLSVKKYTGKESSNYKQLVYYYSKIDNNRKEIDKKLDNPNHLPGKNNVNSKELSFNLNNSKNENSNFASNSAQFTNPYINNYKILTKKNPANLTLKNYLDIKTHKNKINTSA